MLEWMLRSLAARTLPEFGIERYIAPATLGWAAGIGIVAVGVAPRSSYVESAQWTCLPPCA